MSSQQAQGVVFIGVDAPEKASNTLSFLQKHAISYSNVKDTAIDYDVAGLPETIDKDRHGVVVAKWGLSAQSAGITVGDGEAFARRSTARRLDS